MNAMFRQPFAPEAANGRDLAAAIDETPCPVAELARDAQANINADERAEAAEGELRDDEADPYRKDDLEMQREALWDSRENIQERASHLLAKSGAGAMFQLHLISSWANSLYSRTPDDCEQARESKELLKSIQRMLYSVQAYIEKVSGKNPDDACGEHYMPRRYNPHRLINEALAAGDDQPANGPRQHNNGNKTHA